MRKNRNNKMSMHNARNAHKITYILLVFIACVVRSNVLGLNQPEALQPSDLIPPCKLTDIALYADWDGSGHLTIIDEKGSRLKLSYANDILYFEHTDKSVIRSKSGSAEEQILLRILKQSLARTYDPSMAKKDYNFSDKTKDEQQRYFEQKGIKHFIHVLEDRCSTKSQ